MVPRFIQKPRSTEVIEGDSLTIVCEVVGDPKPELVWLRDWLNVSETSSQFPFAPPLCVSLRDFTDNNGRPRDRSRSLGECDLSDAAVFSFFLSFFLSPHQSNRQSKVSSFIGARRSRGTVNFSLMGPFCVLSRRRMHNRASANRFIGPSGDDDKRSRLAFVCRYNYGMHNQDGLSGPRAYHWRYMRCKQRSAGNP